MKKRNLNVVSMVVVIFLLLQNAIPLLALTVPVGTIIQLEVSNTISSTNAYVGQKVNFKVLNDVAIAGNLVVKGGARAFGKIVSVDNSGMLGKPGNLSIQLTRVTAVDGSNIPISANSVLKGEDKSGTAIIVTLILCIFGLFIKGGDAVLQAGSIIEADVISAVDIDTSNIVNQPQSFTNPVKELKQGARLEITTFDGELFIGNLESKEKNVISLFDTKTLYQIQVKKINSVIDNSGNNITGKLLSLPDFKSSTKYNWNSITVKEIK
ncbi:MAG: hypothetical protein U9P73_02845 [Candidatus Cloacimonadota bacterium]|nr:hypothetical protein [Candidatus Cloacimonadota bacterium]